MTAKISAQATLDGKQYESTLNRLQRGNKDFTGKAGSSFKMLSGKMLAVVAAVSAVATVMQKTIMAFDKQAKAEARLNKVLETTGHAAGWTAEELKSMASELQGVTEFGDEAIIAAQSLLATFTNIGKETFPRATEAILDMSVAFGQDLKSSTIQLGKALDDPIKGITALRRVGVSFTEDEQKLIKSLAEAGKTAEAQRLILEGLERQVKGSAKAAGSVGAAEFKKFGNSIGDLAESIGSKLVPVLNPAIKKLNELTAAAARWLDRENIRKERAYTQALKDSDVVIQNLGVDLDKLGKIAGTSAKRNVKYTEAQIQAWKSFSEKVNSALKSALMLSDKSTLEILHNYMEQSKVLDDGLKANVISYEDYVIAVTNLERQKELELDRLRQERVQKEGAAASQAMGFIGQALGNISQIGQNMNQARQNELDERLNKEKEAINASTMTELEKQEKIRLAEEKTASLKRKLARQAAQDAKAFSIFQATIQTAQAIVNFLTAVPPNPFGAIAAGIIGATQIAAIASQPLPPLATGTYNVPQDMNARIHQGEMIVPATMAESIRQGDASLSSASTPVHVVVNLGSKTLYDDITTATRTRDILIDAGSVI